MKKFRKAMNISFVLLPIMLFTIGIPMFYLSFTIKDVNNTKKVLQEAAYTGALAGSYALDINSFEHGLEPGRSTTIENYPIEKESKNPAVFMKQIAPTMRTSVTPRNDNDVLKGGSYTLYPGKAGNEAAKEVVEAVKKYLDINLNKKVSGSKPVYNSSDYSISIKFEREGLIDPSTNASVDGGAGPYNKVSVSVTLNYKPHLLQSINLFGDKFDEPIAVYGTSTAKTKTIK